MYSVPPACERDRAEFPPGGAGVSLVCFSCHDGTTLVDPHVDASTTAFHPLSHGYDLEGYREQIPDSGVLPLADGEKMSCVACHDPHENRHRPFLRLGFGELCQSCHADKLREESEGKVPGNHPVFVEVPETGRETAPLDPAPAFGVPFPGAYPAGGGRTANGVHWDLGGHFDEGGAGRLVCVTCHAVHGDEEAPPLRKLLAMDPVNEIANELCEGCHRGRRGDGMAAPPYPNPGGTSTARTYHPCDDDVGEGGVAVVETRPAAGWPLGSAPSSPILCTTCHAPHDADPGTPLLRSSEAGDFCEECHNTVFLQNHHPLEVDRCGANIPLPAYGGSAGKMYCSTCHRAHNAGLGKEEDLFVPLLREKWEDGEVCASCHPAGNPTCSQNPEQQASHFVGDPNLPETYADPEPPLRRDSWSESGLFSTYGGGGDGTIVTCLSCHTFKERAVVSGDDGTSGYLLARSGNLVEWGEGEEGIYLCTGCHSAAPGTKGGGGSHPGMNADISKLLTEPQLPVTSTPNGRVNCDSCHRSHEADSRSGYYILETVEGQNTEPLTVQPSIDFSVLCGKCHGPEEY
jgi:predicted CXXCH cytochrome family protein